MNFEKEVSVEEVEMVFFQLAFHGEVVAKVIAFGQHLFV